MTSRNKTDGRYTGFRVTELNFGAGLTIWSFRACATGHGYCPPVIEGMTRALGIDGDEGRVQCLAMARTLAEFGRRPICIAQSGSLGVTYDEFALVAAMEAAQRHRFDLRDAQLTRLLGRMPDEDVSDAVQRLAKLFKCAGHSVCKPTDGPYPNAIDLTSETYDRLLNNEKRKNDVHSIQK